MATFKRSMANFLALLGFTLFLLNCVNLGSDPISRNLRTDDEEDVNDTTKDDTTRPVMHTFFSSLENPSFTGMTPKGHSDLLAAWEKSWQSFGWSTKVLTEEDAKLHPDFEAINKKLEQLEVNEYNRFCFWRWLAMSLLEKGGWMSDYDNIPLSLTAEKGMELERKNGLKTWGRHVPALIHADQTSYQNLVKLMSEELGKDLDLKPLSDMNLLKYMHEHYSNDKLGLTTWDNSVYSGFPYISKEGIPTIDCHLAKAYLTAHLSHHDIKVAFKNKTYPKIRGVSAKPFNYVGKRGEAAGQVMKDYRDNCVGKESE